MMKKILITGGLVLMTISNSFAQCDDYRNAMEDVQSYSDNAYTFAMKATKADNLKDAKYYAKKARNYANDVISLSFDAQQYASDCWCSEGQNHARKTKFLASNILSFSKKAYSAYNMENALKFSKKAMYNAKKCNKEASFSENDCD